MLYDPDEMEIDLICEQLSQTLKAPTEIESPSIKFGDEQTEGESLGTRSPIYIEVCA